MTKKVLDVGQCGPDHATITRYLTAHFDCEIVQAHGLDDARDQLKSGDFDLVLVNRKLDADYSDGIEIIRQIKADPEFTSAYKRRLDAIKTEDVQHLKRELASKSPKTVNIGTANQLFRARRD